MVTKGHERGSGSTAREVSQGEGAIERLPQLTRDRRSEQTRSAQAWNRIHDLDRLAAKQPARYRKAQGYIANVKKLHRPPLESRLSVLPGGSWLLFPPYGYELGRSMNQRCHTVAPK